MLVSGVKFDFNWFLQLILTIFVIVFGLLHLMKNTASKYFEVDANFEAGEGGGIGSSEDRGSNKMSGVPVDDTVCIICGNLGSKKCSRCKAVRYCSQKCQEVHWKSGHGTNCKDVKRSSMDNSSDLAIAGKGFRASGVEAKSFSAISLVPCGVSKPIKQPKDILYPYDEFLKLFYWDRVKFPPCGLLNCGNSCFANVVLQCLSFTRPLVAYLLERGHRRECLHDDWCFLCEFQTHVERASQSLQPFSPNNIISRLPNIGGNLGYGRQEDAHEFMRFAIDMMQLVCLDEFGGEKAVHPRFQETTIIQHIFGGHLQSQVICTNCNNISNQYENMMDLTVEIHGDGASLEECLDQFTAKEWLHGDNMYKCDGCNDYVKASKCLTIKHTPNILTIALKRFQSGRFGKLNKKVTFPETLDLGAYMSEAGDGTDIYKLYAVVVHLDMLNASYFGHYICYIKDFLGTWYRIDDCKVVTVDLEEVLSQGAYMILYSSEKLENKEYICFHCTVFKKSVKNLLKYSNFVSFGRVCPRSSSLQAIESSKTNQTHGTSLEMEACPKEQVECFTSVGSVNANYCPGSKLPNGSLNSVASKREDQSGNESDSLEHAVQNGLSTSNMDSSSDTTLSYGRIIRNNTENGIDVLNAHMLGSLPEEVSSCKNNPQAMLSNYKTRVEDRAERNSACTMDSEPVPIEVCENGFDTVSSNCNGVRKDLKDMVSISSSIADDIGVYANGHANIEETYYENGHDQVDETISLQNRTRNGVFQPSGKNNNGRLDLS